jgi:hypothetical protein
MVYQKKNHINLKKSSKNYSSINTKQLCTLNSDICPSRSKKHQSFGIIDLIVMA